MSDRIPVLSMPGNAETMAKIQSRRMQAVCDRLTGFDRSDDEESSTYPYRTTVHQELQFAAKCRRSGGIMLARRAVARARYNRHLANHWQPLP